MTIVIGGFSFSTQNSIKVTEAATKLQIRSRLFFLFLPVAFLYAPLPGKTESLTTDSGKRLYQAHCFQCHGYDGKGSKSSAASLKIDPEKLDLTSEKVVKISRKNLKKLIADGHGQMPGHKDRLSSRDIRSILQYLQTLQKAYVFQIGPYGK